MPQYDLSLKSADFVPWNGPPRKSIVICSHPRSGSTLLGEAITFAGGLGCPLEYLHRGFRPALAERWQAKNIDDYIAAMYRHRTEANGNFSIKLFWQDIGDILLEQSPETDIASINRTADETPIKDYQHINEMIERFFPNPQFIYLYRRDGLRQAVSSLIATQTGIWRAINGAEEKPPSGSADYAYDRIMSLVAFGEYSHAHWHKFFEANAIAPTTIVYEDLIADYYSVVGRLLVELGAENITPEPWRMQRQSDGLSDEWVLRFLQENARMQTESSADIS